MNNKQQAYIYGAPHEGENFRLSKAENRYLRKRNWIRLLQLIGLFSWASFLLLLPLLLFIPLLKDWYDNGINGLAIFLIILCLFVWFIVWKAWGKTLKQAFKTPWWLSLENAKGITLTGHFGTLIHPTGEIENLWTINNTVVDFPKHWTRSLDKIISNFDKPELVTFRVAKIPQATNKVLRLPMTSGQYFRHRTDIVVADPKYVVLQAGLRSIEEDCRINIPIHRNNPFLVGMGVMSLVISLFLGITWHTTIEKEQNAIQTVEKRIQNQIKSIGFERSLEKQELVNRDFPLLSAHKKHEKHLLKTDSISFVVVGLKDEPTKNPFILSSEEYRLIYRLSTVSPSFILGYRNKANSKEIDTYRNKLLTIIDKSKNTSNKLQELWKTKVQSMDNALIENQMRSYGNRLLAFPNFVSELLPLPIVYIPKTPVYTPFCINKSVFCSINSNKIQLIHQKDAFFTVKNNAIFLTKANEMEYLATLQTKFNKLQNVFKHSIWLGWLTLIGFISGLFIIILFMTARIKASRVYKNF